MRIATKQTLWTMVTAAALAVMPSRTDAQSLTQPGTQALGTSNWSYYPCTTTACEPTGGPLGNSQDGGIGQASAFTDFVGVAPGAREGLFLNYLASAQLQGALGMAQLKALAQSKEMTGAPTGYTGLCCYYYDVNAAASALQWYKFTGLQPETFTIAFTIDAIMLGTVDPQTNFDSRTLLSASGGLSIWDGVIDPVLGVELPLGGNLDFSQVYLNGGDADAFGRISGNGSVTFTLNPGSGFFMSSFLSLSIPQLAYGNVLSDASHTMNTMFTAGNTSLLEAQLPGVPLQVVPEPSTFALLLAGGIGASLVRLARRRRPPAP